jgi:hypothetical protein
MTPIKPKLMFDGQMLDGNKVRSLLKTKNVRLERGAVATGVSMSVFRNMLDGYIPRRRPEKALQELAKFLGLEVHDLVVPAKLTNKR